MKDKEKVYLFHGPYQDYFYKYVEYKRGTGRKELSQNKMYYLNPRIT